MPKSEANDEASREKPLSIDNSEVRYEIGEYPYPKDFADNQKPNDGQVSQ